MIKLDSKESLDKELNQHETVLALFYANWCPYCKAFVPIFNKEIETSNIEVAVHVILDDFDNPLWDEYEVEAVPTILFFEHGKVSNRLDGKFGVGLNRTQLTAWLQEISQA